MRGMDEAGHFPGVVVNAGRQGACPAGAALEREFEQAVRDSSDLVVRVAFGVVRQQQDAEEIAQEAFTRAYTRFASLRDPEHFRAWMIRVTWRLAIDRWRADRRRQAREHAAHAPAPVATAEQLALSAERSSQLWKAIDDLPEKQRLVIILSALQGHDLQDVARLLAVPEGTVKSRLFLARKGLAQRLRCLANDSPRR
ncbi:MAG: RNA polymerase sigma factor [Vicinamibacterales bacterium]